MLDLFDTLVIADSDDERMVTIVEERSINGGAGVEIEEWNGIVTRLWRNHVPAGVVVEDAQRRMTVTIALYNITSVIVNDSDGEEIASWQKGEH